MTVLWPCIDPPQYQYAFEIRPGLALGPYDGTSIMHYAATSLALGEGFCNVSLLGKSGFVINPGNTLSPGDIAGLDWLASF